MSDLFDFVSYAACLLFLHSKYTADKVFRHAAEPVAAGDSKNWGGQEGIL